MKHIYLVRHCQATGQEADAPLTALGQEQAKQLAAFFSEYPIDRIIASPFERAVSSIDPFARDRGLSVEQDDRLVERVLSGQPMVDWLDRLRDSFYDLSLQYEGGESSKEAMNRAGALLSEVLSDEARQHVILVSHGCLLTLLMKSVDSRFGFDDWEKLSNPDVFRLTVTDTTRHLERIWSQSLLSK